MTAISERAEIRPSFKDRHPILKDVPDSKFPQSVAIIPDKNRTWATRLGLDPLDGQLAGIRRSLEISDEYDDAPVKRFFLWVASDDNITERDPSQMVPFLSKATEAIRSKKQAMINTNRRLFLVGNPLMLPGKLREAMQDVSDATKNNTGQELYLGAAYGQEDEAIRTTQRMFIHAAQFGARLVANFIKENPGLSDEDLAAQIDLIGRQAGSLVNSIDYINKFHDAEGLWRDVDMIFRTFPDAETIANPDGFFKFYLSGIGDVNGRHTMVYAIPKPFPALDDRSIDLSIRDFSITNRNLGR